MSTHTTIPRRRRTRAFTLIEVMISLGLSVIIAAAAIVVFRSASATTRKMEQQAHADEEAKVLTDWLMTRVQQAGGGTIRPWMVMETDNNCTTTLTVGTTTLPACDQTDRLHVVIQATKKQCTLTSVAGNVATAPLSGGLCCLNAPEFLNKAVVVVAADGGAGQGKWRSTRVTAVDAAACTATLAGANGAFTSAGIIGTTFDGGIITPATTRTFYVDPATRMLNVISDDDDDGVAEIAELADQVADFQVELGFDGNGDQVAEIFQSTYQGTAPPGTARPRNTLRMVRLGVMVAAPVSARDNGAQAKLLTDGPVRTFNRGIYLRTASTTAALRNLDIFF